MKNTVYWKICGASGKVYHQNDFELVSRTQKRDVWQKDGFTVSVDYCRYGDITSGALKISNAPEHILEVRYPVAELPFEEKYDILYGYDLGTVEKADKIVCGKLNTVRLLGVPVFALLNDAGGYYFDSRRREIRSNNAEYFVTEDKKRIKIEIVHCYSPQLSSCDAAFGRFSGKWFEAAEIYRNWREENPLFPERELSEKLRDIDLWVWNRGAIKDVIPPVLELKKTLPDCKLALNWYWWHSNPYDTDYPDFLPPREGWDAFKSAVRLLNENDIYVQVYINGVCWDADGRSWDEGGAESAMVNSDGEIMSQVFNVYTQHRLGFMCGENKKFRSRMLELVKALHDSGLSGQYMDMISHMGAHRCYNPLHKHEPGDVQIMLTGYRDMLEDIHRELPGFPITSESCGECFLDTLDGVTVCNSISSEHLNRKNQDVVPLFPAVYHGKTVLFGNYASISGVPPWDIFWPPEDRWQEEKPWHNIYKDQFFIESARNIVFGVQPTVCDYYPDVATSPEFEERRDFLRRCVKFYHEHKEYLLCGKMLSPDGFVCGKYEFKFLGRMIFTKVDQASEIVKTLPQILHSIWQNSDGSRALILANCTSEPAAWSYAEMSGVMEPRSLEFVRLD